MTIPQIEQEVRKDDSSMKIEGNRQENPNWTKLTWRLNGDASSLEITVALSQPQMMDFATYKEA